MRVLDGVVIVEGEGAVFVINLGLVNVSEGNFGACESDALFPNYFGVDLFNSQRPN